MVGDLYGHNNHEDFILTNRMKWWEEESDKIIINETYEFFDNNSEIIKGVVTKRINFYSFEVMVNSIAKIVPIEKFYTEIRA